MTYTEQTWVDGAAGGTPLSAARLGHIEDGIAAAAAAAAALTPTPTKTADYTALAGELVPVDASGAGNVIVTLPATPTAGDRVGVFKTDGTPHLVVVAGTVEGQTNANIVAKNAGAEFTYINSTIGWKITNSFQVNGANGANGNTVLNGAGAPSSATGVNGDFYIDTTNNRFYGPKAAGAWPGTYVTMAGTAGPAGTPDGTMAAGVIGQYYNASCLAPGGFNARSLSPGTMVVGTPVVIQETITIDQLACSVQTAGAGASVRMGIWKVSSTSPFDLTLGTAYSTAQLGGGDTGLVSAATTGTKVGTLPSPVVLHAGDAVIIGVAVQGSSNVSIYCEGFSGPQYSPWGTSAPANGPTAAFTVSGVTAALPATVTPGAFFTSGVGGCGYYHRSA